MENPLISIIIPVFNAEKWLHRCMDSVLAQTYDNFEIIAVSDGSTDGSDTILQSYAAQDARMQCVYQNNQGVSASRNHGLSMAKGEWICFVDADDYLHRDYLQSMLKAALDHQADVVAVHFFLELENGLRLPYPFILPKKRLSGTEAIKQSFRILHFPTFIWNKLIRRQLLEDNAISFPSILYEDAYVVPMLYSKCDKVIVLKCPRYHYMRRPASLTHAFACQHAQDYLTAANMLRHYFSESGCWTFWEKSYGRWLNRIMVQAYLSLHLSRRKMPSNDRRLLLRRMRSNIKVMKNAPASHESLENLPFPMNP